MSAETTFKSVQDMEPAAREGLRRALLSLADGKRLMGIRYSDWLLGAPSIETGIAASSMAQDEWGHARLLYAMLKDFGMDPAAVEHERAAEEYANPDTLDEPLADWAAVVAACVVVDGALSVALEGFSEGVYEPTRSRIPKMLAEETFHHDLGVAWFRKLAGGSEEGRSRLREAALSMLARTLAWLTPADEVGEAQAGSGLVPKGDVLRSRFAERYGELLSLVDIDLSAVEPDREGWDSERGRGPGRPDNESVARARGDLNRMLFVE